ncbi:MAG: DUF1343 domain-containing protein [Candidatus Sumerlaeia bacterium]|nr:DUF1343 domain-containing protein [Candidatus Sumerlaeia bacterium]
MPDPTEVQLAELAALLHGSRVVLLTNQTGVDGRYRQVAERLLADPQIRLVGFFAPEHGLHGDVQAGDKVEDYADPFTGLPVFSLYGPRRRPTAEQLDLLDVVVFDMQEVGARFYTRLWIMTHVMEACAEAGKRFVVLDRPNPIGLETIEGPPIRFDAGLIGRVWPGRPFGLPTRHAMTVGEIATLANAEWLEQPVALKVVRVPGYRREMTFEQTGYPWVMPSPNMPTRQTARVYPGMGILEGTNLSEGRGTTRPFELVGAPFIDGSALAAALNARGLPGVRFRPAWFTPTFSKHAGELCGGVQLHVTDPRTFEPVRTGLEVLKVCVTMHPEAVELRPGLARLAGIERLHERLAGESVEALVAEWQDDLEQFRRLRARHLLYP